MRRTRAAPGFTGFLVTAEFHHASRDARPRVAHELRKYAVAQAAIGHTQAVGRPDAADRLEDRAAGEHQVGPVRANAGIVDTLLEIPAEKLFHHAVDVDGVHPQAVDATAIVALEIEMHACQRGYRAGRAKQMELSAMHEMVELAAPTEAVEQRFHMADHGAERLAGHFAAAEFFSKRHHADRQRGPSDDMAGEARRALPPDIDQRDLGRTAPDVEQHDALSVALDQRAAAGHGEPRLGLPVDDFERQAGLGLDPCKELGAVRSGTAGLGRNQPRALDRPVAQLVAADLQRLDGAVHRRFGQASVGSQPLAQPDDARERVDDAELAGPTGHRHQQAAIIGAEVKCRENRKVEGLGLARLAPAHARHRQAHNRRACQGRSRQHRTRIRFCSRFARGGAVVARENLASAPALAASLAFGFRVRCPVVASRRQHGSPAGQRNFRAVRRQRESSRRTRFRRTGAGVAVFHLAILRCAARTLGTLHALGFQLHPR